MSSTKPLSPAVLADCIPTRRKPQARRRPRPGNGSGWSVRGIRGRWSSNEDGTRLRAYTRHDGPEVGAGGNVLKVHTLSGLPDSVLEARLISRLLNFAISGMTHRTVKLVEVKPDLFQVSMRFRIDSDSTQQFMPIGETNHQLIRGRHARELDALLRRFSEIEAVLTQVPDLAVHDMSEMLTNVRVPDHLMKRISSSHSD